MAVRPPRTKKIDDVARRSPGYPHRPLFPLLDSRVAARSALRAPPSLHHPRATASAKSSPSSRGTPDDDRGVVVAETVEASSDTLAAALTPFTSFARRTGPLHPRLMDAFETFSPDLPAPARRSRIFSLDAGGSTMESHRLGSNLPTGPDIAPDGCLPSRANSARADAATAPRGPSARARAAAAANLRRHASLGANTRALFSACAFGGSPTRPGNRRGE